MPRATALSPTRWSAEHHHLLHLAALVDEQRGRHVNGVQGSKSHREHVTGAGEDRCGEREDADMLE
jgi:hypothetical protein